MGICHLVGDLKNPKDHELPPFCHARGMIQNDPRYGEI